MQVNPLETVPEEDESAEVATADPQVVEIDVDSQQTAEAAAPVVTMSDLEGTPSETMATPQAPASTHQSAPTPSPTPQSLLQQQGANVNAQPFVSSLSSLGPMPGSEVQFNGNPFENVSGHPYQTPSPQQATVQMGLTVGELSPVDQQILGQYYK